MIADTLNTEGLLDPATNSLWTPSQVRVVLATDFSLSLHPLSTANQPPPPSLAFDPAKTGQMPAISIHDLPPMSGESRQPPRRVKRKRNLILTGVTTLVLGAGAYLGLGYVNPPRDDASLAFHDRAAITTDSAAGDAGTDPNNSVRSDGTDPLGPDLFPRVEQPTLDATAEGDMMSLRIEPSVDIDSSIPPATATIRDGLVHIEGNFRSEAVAQLTIQRTEATFGEGMVVESYSIHPNAPDPRTDAVTLDKPVLFAAGSAEIHPDYIPFLAACGDVLKLNPHITMSISAFTDSLGSAEYNLQLSQQRAQAIYDFYAAYEVDEVQLISVGRGETEPVAENDSDQGRAKNRRAMLQLLNTLGPSSNQ